MDKANCAERTTLLGGLLKRIWAHVSDPEREAPDQAAGRRHSQLLADHGHEVEWIYGAQRESTWNIRLVEGSEIHLARRLEDLGLALPREAWPPVGSGARDGRSERGAGGARGEWRSSTTCGRGG